MKQFEGPFHPLTVPAIFATTFNFSSRNPICTPKASQDLFPTLKKNSDKPKTSDKPFRVPAQNLLGRTRESNAFVKAKTTSYVKKANFYLVETWRI